MQSENVTTPFGRRRMTLALVKRQLETARAEVQVRRPVDKWKLFRDVCEAKDVFGLQDRALAVLDALLSFYPESELSEEHGLIVFPSNAQLSIRAHGITGTTLRRHLAALVEAGLIQRRDSPNGKRYARKGRGGEIEDAFGFNLAPLLARAEELAALAQEVADERLRFKRTREALTLCRRDVRKLISAAMEEGADGDWAAIEQHYVTLVARLPRNPARLEIAAILDEMDLLRQEILNILEMQLVSSKTDANADRNGAHKQNSNTHLIHESEPRFEKKQDAPNSVPEMADLDRMPAFPLGTVMRACPQIGDYGPGGAVAQWRDLLSAAVVVRSTLGISPSAYQDACDTMGAEDAAIAVACILERAGHIQSAGGYLRDLTRRAARGEFSLGPMLMALLRTATPASKAG
ncbi:MAG: replication initiation protein RepC [Rhizobiales bacterium]|nr:replication initiation protein RepC [Hyphomicrobiales bacterium]